jgi:hypothetical protein
MPHPTQLVSDFKLPLEGPGPGNHARQVLELLDTHIHTHTHTHTHKASLHFRPLEPCGPSQKVLVLETPLVSKEGFQAAFTLYLRAIFSLYQLA